MNVRLASASARRVAHASVALALVLAAVAALQGGEASALAEAGGLRDEAARAAGRIEAAWTAFLVLVVPCLLVRAAAVRTRGEVQWVCASRTTLARAELARATGAVAAALAFALVWSLFAALGPATPGPVLARAGTAEGPALPLFDHAAPLLWSAQVADDADLRARVGVSLSITGGGGGEVWLRAVRGPNVREGNAHVLPRGAVEVEIPPGKGRVDFRLALPEPGARGFVTSDQVELWTVASASAPKSRLAARVALALAAWTMLAFGLGAWLRPLTVLSFGATVALAVWAHDVESAWIPGSSLALDLASVAEGRAPSPLAAREIAGLVGAALVGLALARRPAEDRP